MLPEVGLSVQARRYREGCRPVHGLDEGVVMFMVQVWL